MFEYKVVPAPKRGLKGKGVKGNEGRFANALEAVMNDFGKLGWEYIRTDTLPSEEREGLMGRTTVFQNMLVFRRALAGAETADEPAVGIQEEETPLLEDKSHEPEPEPISEPEMEPETQDVQPQEDPVPAFRSEPRITND